MIKSKLIERLKLYQPLEGRENGVRERFVSFLESEPDCFHRTLLKGHVTGSAFIVDPTRSQCLLLFHTKLEKWLQPGGHADGNPNVLDVAIRESEEETGLSGFRVVTTAPFDLDIHSIPARGAEPEHLHYDIRYLLEADPKWKLDANSESKDLRWIPLSEVPTLTSEESVLRMVDKVRQM